MREPVIPEIEYSMLEEGRPEGTDDEETEAKLYRKALKAYRKFKLALALKHGYDAYPQRADGCREFDNVPVAYEGVMLTGAGRKQVKQKAWSKSWKRAHKKMGMVPQAPPMKRSRAKVLYSLEGAGCRGRGPYTDAASTASAVPVEKLPSMPKPTSASIRTLTPGEQPAEGEIPITNKDGTVSRVFTKSASESISRPLRRLERFNKVANVASAVAPAAGKALGSAVGGPAVGMVASLAAPLVVSGVRALAKKIAMKRYDRRREKMLAGGAIKQYDDVLSRAESSSELAAKVKELAATRPKKAQITPKSSGFTDSLSIWRDAMHTGAGYLDALMPGCGRDIVIIGAKEMLGSGAARTLAYTAKRSSPLKVMTASKLMGPVMKANALPKEKRLRGKRATSVLKRGKLNAQLSQALAEELSSLLATAPQTGSGIVGDLVREVLPAMPTTPGAAPTTIGENIAAAARAFASELPAMAKAAARPVATAVLSAALNKIHRKEAQAPPPKMVKPTEEEVAAWDQYARQRFNVVPSKPVLLMQDLKQDLKQEPPKEEAAPQVEPPLPEAPVILGRRTQVPAIDPAIARVAAKLMSGEKMRKEELKLLRMWLTTLEEEKTARKRAKRMRKEAEAARMRGGGYTVPANETVGQLAFQGITPPRAKGISGVTVGQGISTHQASRRGAQALQVYRAAKKNISLQ